MTEVHHHIEASGAVNPLLAAIIVNAWYTAQNVYLAENGSLSAEEKARLLCDVMLSQGKIQRLIEEAKTLSSLKEPEMTEHLKRIFE